MIITLTLSLCLKLIIQTTRAQDVNIVLNQGTIVGLKVFPETSRIPIFTYLGVPYAEKPINNLRFAPPQPIQSSNKTLLARDFKSICPQLDNNIYEEVESGSNLNSNRKGSEDCLYLNIWTPETALRNGGFPVLVMITGEEFGFDWAINRPTGLDLASEGIIIVQIQYRTNIFGWLTLETKEAPGNTGLLDQIMAFSWVKDNIHKFGGNANKLTILGHGTSGSSNAMIHLTNPNTSKMFSQAILMSGSLYSQEFLFNTAADENLSREIIASLSCQSNDKNHILNCLQRKSVEDLLRAYESIYKNGNYTKILGPIIDDYLAVDIQTITENPIKMLEQKRFNDIPILIGICSNEGAFIREQWIDLGKQGFVSIRNYINSTSLPNLIDTFNYSGFGQKQVLEAINWKYFDQLPKNPAHVINALQKILSEAKFELPHFKTIEALSNSNIEENFNQNLSNTRGTTSEGSNLFVYLFHHSNSMDLRGKTNYFGGASHSSDLPFLLGPSLFQQISRRRLTQSEEKLCKKIRNLFGEFIKTGHPTPGGLYNSWHAYTATQKYIRIISAGKSEHSFSNKKEQDQQFFEDNLSKIEQMLTSSMEDVQIVTSDLSIFANNPYSLNKDRDQEYARSAKNAVFLSTEIKNSDYFYYLKGVYGFWYDFLPKLVKVMNNQQDDINEKRIILNEENVLYLANGTPKYKHAFFSMLTLVCLLLALLCVCVYILKKNNATNCTNSKCINSSIL